MLVLQAFDLRLKRGAQLFQIVSVQVMKHNDS